MSRKGKKRTPIIPLPSPIIFKLEPSADAAGKTLGWRIELARMIHLLQQDEFTHDDANRMYEYIGTCFVIAKMSRNQAIKNYIDKAADCFINMLQRYSAQQKWQATSDEISTLATRLDSLAEAIGTLPESTIRLAMTHAELEMAQMRKRMIKIGEIAA